MLGHFLINQDFRTAFETIIMFNLKTIRRTLVRSLVRNPCAEALCGIWAPLCETLVRNWGVSLGNDSPGGRFPRGVSPRGVIPLGDDSPGGVSHRGTFPLGDDSPGGSRPGG